MKCSVGIDLGSTTTKAVVLGEDGGVLGRGITNSRSNYHTACEVALREAFIDAQFGLIESGLVAAGVPISERSSCMASLGLRFRARQYLAAVAKARAEM